jgi:hypothetical protein
MALLRGRHSGQHRVDPVLSLGRVARHVEVHERRVAVLETALSPSNGDFTFCTYGTLRRCAATSCTAALNWGSLDGVRCRSG